METLPSNLKYRSLAKCRINNSEKENHIPRGSTHVTWTERRRRAHVQNIQCPSTVTAHAFFFPTQVLEDQQNIRLIRELLQTLYTSLCTLVQRVGKSVLVGNINMWVYRMETILHWQQQLNNVQITRVSRNARPPPSSKDFARCLHREAGRPPRDFLNLLWWQKSLDSSDRMLSPGRCEWAGNSQ